MMNENTAEVSVPEAHSVANDGKTPSPAIGAASRRETPQVWTYPAFPILLVDDDPSVLDFFKLALQARNVTNTIACDDGRDVRKLLEGGEIGVMLLDLSMPEVSGQELLEWATAEHPEVPVIVITGIGEVDTAVECMKAGAFDYMVKPVDDKRLVSGVHRAIEICELRRENALLRQFMFSDTLQNPEAFREIITADPNMRTLFQYVETIVTCPRERYQCLC